MLLNLHTHSARSDVPLACKVLLLLIRNPKDHTGQCYGKPRSTAFPVEIADVALGCFRRDVGGQDEMHIWKVYFCCLLLAPKLEKGSFLRVNYINVFAELLPMGKEALCQEGLLSL